MKKFLSFLLICTMLFSIIPCVYSTESVNADTMESEIQSFMFDENGDVFELGEDFDYEAVLTAEAATEDYTASDAGVVYFEDFEKYNEGNAEGEVDYFQRIPYPEDADLSLYQTTTNAKVEKGNAVGNDTKYLSVNIPSDANSSATKNTDFVLSFAGMSNSTSVIENGILEVSFKAMASTVNSVDSGIVSWSGINSSDTETGFPGIETTNYTFKKSGSTYCGYNLSGQTKSYTLGSNIKWSDWHEYTAVMNVENGLVTGIDHFVDNSLVVEDYTPSKLNSPAPGLLKIRPNRNNLGSTVYIDDVTVVSYEKKLEDTLSELDIQDTYNYNFELATAKNGVNIVYTIEESPYITYDGRIFKVTLPARKEEQVKINVAMEYDNGGSFPMSKVFEKTIILPVDDSEGALENELAREDVAALEIGINTAKINEDFSVPVKGSINNSDIVWSSNSEYISIDETGKATVTIPPYTGQQGREVVLTASVTNSISQTYTKKFNVRVLEREPQTDEEKVLYEKNNFKIKEDLTDIREDFYLPRSEYASIVWTTNNNAIEIVDDGFDTIAKVKAPLSGEIEVIITATITSGDVTATKEFTATVKSYNNVKAFPGAEGYGAYSKGGRGGYVYHVTNLSGDSETEGSLAYGIEKLTGARTIVFDVGGTIDLTERGKAIAIEGESGSNITIAGQTAPYPGIQLKGYGITMSNVHDVVMRHIRIRLGDVMEDGVFLANNSLTVTGVKNSIIDHCSFTWYSDMGLNVKGENLTLSNSIISKSLYENSTHDKGGGYAYAAAFGSKKASFIKNYVSDSVQRSPRLVDGEYVNAYNNLLYNNNYGFDVTNYEYFGENVIESVHDNFAQDGPNYSNQKGKFIRINRGRDYAGGILLYGQRNFATVDKSDDVIDNTGTVANYLKNYYIDSSGFDGGSIKYTLQFGEDNTTLINGSTSKYPEEYDLSNVTLDEWIENPLSYNNNNKTTPAATLTFLPYPLPAPRENIVNDPSDSPSDAGEKIFEYVTENVGATKPARDLLDAKYLAEAKSKSSGKASISKSLIQRYCNEMNIRTQYVKSESDGENVKKNVYDVEEVMAVMTNPEKPEGYEDRWSERAKDYVLNGANANYVDGRSTNNLKDTIYTNNGDSISWSVSKGDGPVIEGAGSDKVGSASTPIAIKWDDSWWEEYVGFPMNGDVIYHTNADIPSVYRTAEQNANLGEIIVWDSMGDGIPDWYKDVMGWDKTKAMNNVYLENGYTCLEDYLAFIAGDEEFDTTKVAVAENFKVSKLGSNMAQPYWNTDYRAKCRIYYGKQSETSIENYENCEQVKYTSRTDGYNTYHSTILSELEPETTYYYRVVAIDEFGGESVSEEQSFSTLSADGSIESIAPVVKEVKSYINQVYLKWDGDEASNEVYRIKYGTNSGEYTEITDIIDADTCEATITGLENGTKYYFVVESIYENDIKHSEEVSAIPTNSIINYDYSKMSKEEQEEYIANTFIYNLGGTIGFKEKEVAGGETVLEYCDTSQSHGTNSKLNFPVNQNEIFTTEIQLMVERYMPTYGTEVPAIFYLNFYMDNEVDESGSSSGSHDFTQLYSVTLNQGNIMYNSNTAIGEYNSIRVPYSSDSSTATKEAKNFAEVIETPLTADNIVSGDVEWIDLKIVTDCKNNSVTIYKNGEMLESGLKFDETVSAPYNIGCIEFKTRNDGKQVTSVKSVNVYSGTESLADLDTPNASVISVKLNRSSVTLNEGSTTALMATVLPDNVISKEVEWTSSNEEVATVSADGIVEANSVGAAIITATALDGGKSASCIVTVKETAVDTIPVQPVDKTGLKATIDRAKAIGSDAYTESSYAALIAAIETANEVYENADASRVKVNNAIIGIEIAIEGLVENQPKPSETQKPTETPEPTQTASPTESEVPTAEPVQTPNATEMPEPQSTPEVTETPTETDAPDEGVADYPYSINNVKLDGKVLTADIDYSGNGNDASAKLITALYNQAGVLADFRIEDINGSTKLEKSEMISEDSKKIKLYIWDSLDSVLPLSEIAEVNAD